MEHSIIVLVALVLLIVFAGFQFQKVLDLFRTSKEVELPATVKTVVKAEDIVASKSKTKKTVKSSAKKASAAKKSTKKVSNKKPATTKKVEMPIQKKTAKKK